MANQILTLAELARKAETEQEKARWHAFTSAAKKIRGRFLSTYHHVHYLFPSPSRQRADFS